MQSFDSPAFILLVESEKWKVEGVKCDVSRRDKIWVAPKGQNKIAQGKAL